MRLRDRKCWTVFWAIVPRLIFGIHSVVAIWRALLLKNLQTEWYSYLLFVPVGLLLIETLFTAIGRKGKELNWFFPSFLIYLACILPSLWILELQRISDTKDAINSNSTLEENKTDTTLAVDGIPISFTISLTSSEWVLYLEQSMMVILIIARWISPKGDMTRDELSQLLLVYLSLAADIIDLFGIFNNKEIIDNSVMVYAILSIWSWSLLQFTFALTAIKGRGKNMARDNNEVANEEVTKEVKCCDGVGCLGTETAAIFFTIIMQDGPFLTIRLLAAIHFKVVNYTMVFFIGKNIMIILLQLYRLVVLHMDTNGSRPTDIVSPAQDFPPHLKPSENPFAKKRKSTLQVDSIKGFNE